MGALQALSLYAQRVTKIPLTMTVDVTEKHETVNKLNTFSMNEGNALVLQTQKLTKLPSKLVLDTAGAGCAMVQTVLRYNMPEVQQNNGFTITAQGNTNTIDDPSLTICAAYTGDEKENKVVLYFDSMSKKEKCFDLELKQVMDVEEAKDALITIYDYYNREETASVLYNLI